jgi:hypothetical protein
MNDDEKRTARSREQAAFMRGHAYGCEQTINAHDPLIAVIVEFQRATLAYIRDADEDDAADVAVTLADAHRRVMAAMADVRRVRENGGADSLAVFDIEQAMAVGS